MDKAVIFDLDGTLLDTIDDITDSINGMLNEYGYKAIDKERVRAIIGSGAEKLIADALPEKLKDGEFVKRLETYNRIYNASGSPKTKLFGGVKETLKELKNRGYRLAVLSNKPQHSTDKVAEKYLSGLGFDYIAGQSEIIKCKPDPAGALYVLKELGASP
ncbi:MAG: HAD hydrolase-like protein, partial [Clostridia bacterium]|nr:HAD hydrolase-like protein [Clostridia bacterium]